MKKILVIASLLLATGISRAQCSPNVVSAFGGTCSVALYNTYITIGAIADGYVSDTYDAERVQSLMDEQISMIASLSGMMITCKNDDTGSLSADDKDYIADVITCLDYLKGEAEGLRDVALTGSDEASAAYDTNRDLAWSLIEELLGLGETDDGE